MFYLDQLTKSQQAHYDSIARKLPPTSQSQTEAVYVLDNNKLEQPQSVGKVNRSKSLLTKNQLRQQQQRPQANSTLPRKTEILLNHLEQQLQQQRENQQQQQQYHTEPIYSIQLPQVQEYNLKNGNLTPILQQQALASSSKDQQNNNGSRLNLDILDHEANAEVASILNNSIAKRRTNASETHISALLTAAAKASRQVTGGAAPSSVNASKDNHNV